MSLPSQPSQLEKVASPVTIFNEKLNRHFQVFREGSDLYQSEYELDAEGNLVFKNTHKVEYVVGSGANGHSYVVRRGDYLFQAPLSFYSKPKEWNLSPGYEFADYGFGRLILPGCVVCHSGQAQVVPQRPGLYRDPAFRELAIGCENCHGPGQLHVEERAKGVRIPSETDRSIVNPARLPSWLADNICMNCHQGGEARILQPGKDYFDFRPGTPLNETVAIFRIPFKRESPPDSDLLEHYSSMVLSKCYQESEGRLSCLSCHNPHFEPSRQEATAYFRNKCLSCHKNASEGTPLKSPLGKGGQEMRATAKGSSCSLPLENRLSHDPPNNCSGCHLPKREAKVIAHSALTNHRIPARKNQAFPESAFRQTTSSPTDLIHMNAIPGKEDAKIPPLTLLQAYGELMHANPDFRERYLSLLDEVTKTEPNHPLVLSALGRRSMLTKTPEGNSSAMQYLSRAIQLGSVLPSDYQDLAELLAGSDRIPEAIEILKQGIAIAPFTPALYKSLALRYITLKRYPEALETMKRELELFPEDSFMRKLIKQAESGAPNKL